tara:strand:- start:199 stop:951 length:753 start_codon:yes stop_codon:yes gene_type:complete
MREELKIVGFAAIVCIICSLLLSAAYSQLVDQQVRNVKLDQKYNVLKALGVPVINEKGKKVMTPDEVEQFFSAHIEATVLDMNGNILPDAKADELTDAQIAGLSNKPKDHFPIYALTDPETGDRRYAIHISGKGLWSTLKGYLALDNCLQSVVGITFYEHKETPGLGGEVDKPWFQDQFPEKLVYANGNYNNFRVVKGKVVDVYPKGADHAVDGIPGATMTSKGLQRFMNGDIATYRPYLDQLRAEAGCE